MRSIAGRRRARFFEDRMFRSRRSLTLRVAFCNSGNDRDRTCYRSIGTLAAPVVDSDGRRQVAGRTECTGTARFNRALSSQPASPSIGSSRTLTSGWVCDTTHSTPSFLPIHLYKHSHRSQSDIADRIRKVRQARDIRGFVLPQPQFPRDYRNLKAFGTILPSDLIAFYRLPLASAMSDSVIRQIEHHRQHMPDNVVPLYHADSLQCGRLQEVIESQANPEVHVQVLSSTFDRESESIKDFISKMQANSFDVWVWLGTDPGSEALTNGDAPDTATATAICRSLVASTAIDPSRIVVRPDANDSSAVASLVDIGVSCFVVSESATLSNDLS